MKEKKLDENIKFFNIWAKFYDYTPIIGSWLRHIQIKSIKEIKIKDNLSILDIGCGTGYSLLKISEKTNNSILSGIDISEEMLKIAKTKTESIKKNKIILKKASAEKIPFESNFFDYIICTDALHHFINPQASFNEMSRILKKGGKIIIADVNIGPLWLSNILFKLEPGFIHMYEKREMHELFQKNKIKTIKQKRIGLFALMNIGEKYD